MRCPFCNYEHDNEGDRYGCPNCHGEPLTPSQHCKAHGFNLADLSKASGLSRQTLINWHKSRPEVFRLLVLGVVSDCQTSKSV